MKTKIALITLIVLVLGLAGFGSYFYLKVQQRLADNTSNITTQKELLIKQQILLPLLISIQQNGGQILSQNSTPTIWDVKRGYLLLWQDSGNQTNLTVWADGKVFTEKVQLSQ